MTRLPSFSACVGLLFAALASTVHAAPAPLHTELTLTRIAVDKWRADYVFAEPVTAIDLGPQAGQYRQKAWRTLTPGVSLVAQDGKEAMRSKAPLKKLSVEISAYDDFAEGQYAPIDRFSDGGSDFFLGFLHGTPMQGKRERSMNAALHLKGLQSETVIAPAKPGDDLGGYAYFGPRKPEPMGSVNVIIDPQAPPWLRDVIQDTTARVSQFYETVFERKLTDKPLVSVALVAFDGAPTSINIKGGAVGGGIAYRMQGRGLLEDSPKKRNFVARLVAHEMAHVWQINVQRGGIGGQDAWIHEGGAEAIMLEALRATGIFTEEASDQYAQALLKECEQLKENLTSYRGLYACGFKRFNGYAMAPVPLWRALMHRTEESGNAYSEAMIHAILK